MKGPSSAAAAWQAVVPMGLVKGAKWLVGLLVAGLLLLLLSVFVADDQLEPVFEDRGFVEVPIGERAPSSVFYFSSDATGTLEVYFREQAGGDIQTVTNDPAFDSWRPRISPDRRTVLFYRTPVGVGDNDLSQAALWMVGAQGGEPVEVLPVGAFGWTMQAHAEWSPVGNELAMMVGRQAGTQIWVTSVDGRSARGVVISPGDHADPSWSPDARRLLYTSCSVAPCQPLDREVFAVFAAGDAEPIQLTNDNLGDAQPQFSPDGSEIAMRSLIIPGDLDGREAVWDIRVVPTNRSQPPRRLVSDDSASAAPEWLDDETLVFHRSIVGATTDIYTVTVANGAVTELLATAADEQYPSP